MGRFSRKEWIYNDTEHFIHLNFGVKYFKEIIYSVDFQNKESKLVVLGERDDEDPMYTGGRNGQRLIEVDFPPLLNSLKGNYEWINCEFIGNKLIEVHFRRNPDFRYENNVAIPVWKDRTG
jgi:hypothetical protein